MGDPTPVTKARIGALLEELAVNYEDAGKDGPLIATWENARVFVFVEEDRARIEATWRGELREESDITKARELNNQCNEEQIFPRAYLEKINDFHGVTAMNSLYSKHGQSDEQLREWVGASLQLTLGYLEEIETALPHLVVWQSEEETEGE